MERSIDAMTAAYDALLDAAAAALRDPCRAALADLKHRLDAFAASCDSAEDLVRAAACRVAASAGAGDFASSAPAEPTRPAGAGSRLEELWHAVQAIVGDPPAGSGDAEAEAEVEEEAAVAEAKEE